MRAAETKVEEEQRQLEGTYLELKALLESDAPDTTKLDGIVDTYMKTMRFMRLIEREVSIDEVAGHSLNERWRRFRASTAYNALQEAARVLPRLREWATAHGGEGACTPNDHAFSEMQRLVSEEYPEKAAALRTAFVAAGLPVFGFDDPVDVARAKGQGASLHLTNDSLKLENLASSDVRDIAKGSLLRSEGVLAAPAAASSAADILDKVKVDPPPAPPASPSRLQLVGTWLKDVGTKVLAGLIVASLAAYFGISQCGKDRPIQQPADGEGPPKSMPIEPGKEQPVEAPASSAGGGDR